MSHERPCGEAGAVQFQRLPEVNNGLEVFSHKGVVVAHNAAGLRIVLVVIKGLQSQICQLSLVLPDVQNIGVGVHVLIPVGIDRQQFLVPVRTAIKL